MFPFCSLYKTNRFQVAVRLFSNRSQKTSKCGKNISDTLACGSCATFLFLPHFDVICDLLLNRRTATWNLFVKWTARPCHELTNTQIHPEVEFTTSPSFKTTRKKLKIFATHEVPQILQSDNRPPFNGHAFTEFQHKRMTPLQPKLQGQVERFSTRTNRLSPSKTPFILKRRPTYNIPQSASENQPLTDDLKILISRN